MEKTKMKNEEGDEEILGQGEKGDGEMESDDARLRREVAEANRNAEFLETKLEIIADINRYFKHHFSEPVEPHEAGRFLLCWQVLVDNAEISLDKEEK